MEITIKLNVLNKHELMLLASNSLERVLNEARRIIEKHNKDNRYGNTIADLEDLSPTASRLWYSAASVAMVT